MSDYHWVLKTKKKGYNPSQPRVPAGHSAGGQWTSGGADSSPALRAVMDEERKIQQEPREHLVAIGEDGKVILKTGGMEDAVGIPDEKRAQVTDKRVIITHNHPNGASLNVNDIMFGRAIRAREIRAVTPSGKVYRLKPEALKSGLPVWPSNNAIFVSWNRHYYETPGDAPLEQRTHLASERMAKDLKMNYIVEEP